MKRKARRKPPKAKSDPRMAQPRERETKPVKKVANDRGYGEQRVADGGKRRGNRSRACDLRRGATAGPAEIKGC